MGGMGGGMDMYSAIARAAGALLSGIGKTIIGPPLTMSAAPIQQQNQTTPPPKADSSKDLQGLAAMLQQGQQGQGTVLAPPPAMWDTQPTGTGTVLAPQGQSSLPWEQSPQPQLPASGGGGSGSLIDLVKLLLQRRGGGG